MLMISRIIKLKKMLVNLKRHFLRVTSSLADEIDSVQLQQLLQNKDGKYFDQQLCDELVDIHGDGGNINYGDFKYIWETLQERRAQFERLARGRSELTKEEFRQLLGNVAGQYIPSSFLKRLTAFYKNQISFDVVVHAIHHIHIISSRLNFSDNEELMEEFLGSVFSKVPTAPSEEDITRFSPEFCTYI